MCCVFCKDSVSSVTAALSKNQKKRARKRAKKATEGGGTDDNEGERSGEAERVREIEERIVIDPAVELKMKLEEAKANKVWMVHTYSWTTDQETQSTLYIPFNRITKQHRNSESNSGDSETNLLILGSYEVRCPDFRG